MSNAERHAIGLYAVLARDPSDFIDMVREDETTSECLRILLLMLETPNPKHDQSTAELNSIGADMVRREMERRHDVVGG